MDLKGVLGWPVGHQKHKIIKITFLTKTHSEALKHAYGLRLGVKSAKLKKIIFVTKDKG
jgi:hypothetical protein